MRAIITVLAVAVLIALPSARAADADTSDRRLAKLLDKMRIAYDTDDQGDFRVTYVLPDSRSQLVIVRSQTVRYGELELRELVSAAYRSEATYLPSDVANRLLELAARAPIGGWTRNGPMALLVTRVPADADARELASALEFTARAADAAESELGAGKDEY